MKLNPYKVLLAVFLVIIFFITLFEIIFSLNLNNKLSRLQKQNSLLNRKIALLKKELNSLKQKKSSEIEDYYKSLQTPAFKTSVKKVKKPQLVIIIDDVAFRYEVNRIKSIPLHITPSFFPPDRRHPNTPRYAKEFPHYMVHLPLEAMNYISPESNTLKVNMSQKEILNRISKIHSYFPKAKFINNHTGSRFTNSLFAMKKLFYALQYYKLGFVDSVTIGSTKSLKLKKSFNIPIYFRDIFLDNELRPEYIKNQLKKAVKIAKKYGYCIAIAHPHKTTLNTIKNSLNLLKDVKVVYIDELNTSK